MGAQEGRIPNKKLLQAVVLILFSNLLLIGNNYVVAWTKLTSPEIVLVRGVFQVIIFVFLVCRNKEAKESGSPSRTWLAYGLASLYGFSLSTSSLAVLTAIPLMPIGDLIVISFTSPVFSVFIDRLVNKRSLTLLSICL